jgi:hypothetical protein
MNERNLTDHQAHPLRHMLGINDPSARVPEPYRNYAAVPAGCAEYERLYQLGLIERGAGPTDAFPYVFWRCTDLGRQLAIDSHRRIRLKRDARRSA